MCVMLSLELEGGETERAWLDRALAEAETPRQRQSVESDYVTVATVGGDLEEGVRHARESLRLAEGLDDPATLADALSSLARLEQLLGHGLRRDLLERIDALHELRKTERLEETVGLIRTTVNSAALLATADEFDEARGRGAALHALLDRQGLVESLPEVLRFRAELECLAGDWDLAEALAARGRRAGGADRPECASRRPPLSARLRRSPPRARRCRARAGRGGRSHPPRRRETTATSCDTSPSSASSSLSLR